MNRKYLATTLLTLALTVAASGFAWADNSADTSEKTDKTPKETSETTDSETKKATRTEKETEKTKEDEKQKDEETVSKEDEEEKKEITIPQEAVPTAPKPSDNQVIVEDAFMGDLAFQRLDEALDMCIIPSSQRIRVCTGKAVPQNIRAIQVEKKILTLNPMDDYGIDRNEYSEIVSGTNGNDKFDLGPGNDVVYGGSGNDILIGGSGSDTFVFNGAFGSDSIYDRTTSLYRWDDINELVFGDLKSSEVKFSKEENTLIIQSALDENNKVTVVGFFAGDRPIQNVKFIDTTLTAEELNEKVK